MIIIPIEKIETEKTAGFFAIKIHFSTRAILQIIGNGKKGERRFIDRMKATDR